MAEKKQDDQLEHTYIHTYIQQLCEDTGCSPEDQPEAIYDREKWRERVRDIRASGMMMMMMMMISMQVPSYVCVRGIYCVVVIIMGSGFSNSSSKPEQGCLHSK